MKGMKIDYILPRLLTLFYIQDPTVDENSEKCKLYKENVDKFKEKIKENVKAQQNNTNQGYYNKIRLDFNLIHSKKIQINIHFINFN